METESNNGRAALIRRAAILQVKLLVDGLRDAALIPLSLVATLLGLMRGGSDCHQEFDRVIKLGRRSERWINLFGHQPVTTRKGPGGSLDTLLDRVEEVVTEQYQKGHSAEEARQAIREALKGTREPRDET